MEHLVALKFCDVDHSGTADIDTKVFSAGVRSGQGRAGCSNLSAGTAQGGGSLSTTAPAVGYVDYLDASGNLVASTANWEYIRVWQIVAQGTNMKQISVLARASPAVGSNRELQQTTVVAL